MTSIEERLFDERMSRGRVLRLGAVGAVGVIAAGCGGSSKSSSGAGSATGRSDEAVTLNWLTWSDHYANDQLAAVKNTTNEQGRPTAVQRQRRRLPEDQADGKPVRHRVRRRALGSEVQQGRADGVVRPLVASRLVTAVLDRTDLPVLEGRVELHGLSVLVVDACRSTTTRSTSRRCRTRGTRSSTRSTQGKISLENIPTDMMAIAGRATGAKEPYYDDRPPRSRMRRAG